MDGFHSCVAFNAREMSSARSVAGKIDETINCLLRAIYSEIDFGRAFAGQPTGDDSLFGQ